MDKKINSEKEIRTVSKSEMVKRRKALSSVNSAKIEKIKLEKKIKEYQANIEYYENIL